MTVKVGEIYDYQWSYYKSDLYFDITADTKEELEVFEFLYWFFIELFEY